MQGGQKKLQNSHDLMSSLCMGFNGPSSANSHHLAVDSALQCPFKSFTVFCVIISMSRYRVEEVGGQVCGH